MLGKIFKKDAAKLRQIADEAVARWRELDAAAKAARQTYLAYCTANPLPDTSRVTLRSSPALFEHTIREIPVLEADEAAAQAAHTADAALGAAEVAEGNEQAIARDAERLHADLVTFFDEERELLRKLEDVRARIVKRTNDAVQADASYASRREPAGLPVSVRLPTSWGVDRAGFLERLDERVQKGAPLPNKKAAIESKRGRTSHRRRLGALEARRRGRKEGSGRREEISRTERSRRTGPSAPKV